MYFIISQSWLWIYILDFRLFTQISDSNWVYSNIWLLCWNFKYQLIILNQIVFLFHFWNSYFFFSLNSVYILQFSFVFFVNSNFTSCNFDIIIIPILMVFLLYLSEFSINCTSCNSEVFHQKSPYKSRSFNVLFFVTK